MTASAGGHRSHLAAIGKAIRLRRVELDLKRTELAERAGLSYAYVAEIENGTKQASSKALWLLAGALGLEPHELLASAARLGTPEPPPMAPARRMGVAALAAGPPGEAAPAGASRSRWFHGGAEEGPASGAAAAAAPEGSVELPELLERLEAALAGVADERAELALMLALDERRTRRIVREELGRDRP